jgi:hypothetical protein
METNNWLHKRVVYSFSEVPMSQKVKNHLFKSKTNAMKKFDRQQQSLAESIEENIEQIFYVPKLSFVRVSSYLFATFLAIFISVSMISAKDTTKTANINKNQPVKMCLLG